MGRPEGQEHTPPYGILPIPATRYSLLALSDDVVVISPGGYEPWKMQVRNEWTVDQCDVLLAIWDGSRCGPANCCWCVERVERPIENLWGEWLRLNDSDSTLASGDRVVW